MKEDFLPIPAAPSYEVNSKFQVRNIKTGRILKPYLGYIVIHKFKIRRKVETLRQQAVTAEKERDKKTQWEEIPGYIGLYEINTRGLVRNVKTKRILKTCQRGKSKSVALFKNDTGKRFLVSSLLWEVHGKIPRKRYVKTCSVTIRKNGEGRHFLLIKECAEFLSKREKITADYVRKVLGKRIETFRGWQISYRENF